jgi:signal transduction histidine kinase
LYLVRQIVNRHDGEVDVETAEGEGSTFTLVLPTAEEASVGDQ